MAHLYVDGVEECANELGVEMPVVQSIIGSNRLLSLRKARAAFRLAAPNPSFLHIAHRTDCCQLCLGLEAAANERDR